MRTVRLPSGRNIILSDTVGFISELPTHLVAAFRATLDEVIAADLILHVRDLSHPDCAAQAADVRDVLTSLGIGEGSGHRPLEAWNKRSEEHTSELQSLMRIAYAVSCLQTKRASPRYHHLDNTQHT